MKNQKGISLITLVITIVIAILLAAISIRSGALDNTQKAYYAGFAQQMKELQLSISEQYAWVKNQEISRAHSVSDAQVYNYLARGGEMANPPITKDASGDKLWLTRTQASSISCTPLNIAYAKKNLQIKVAKVDTNQSLNQTLSYFVTPKGRVFCWPPYVNDDKSYVTATDLVTKPNGTAFTGFDATKPDTIGLITFGSVAEGNLEQIYVKTVEVAPTNLKIVPNTTEVETSSADKPAVYYVPDIEDTVTGGTSVGYTFSTTP